MSLAGTVVVLNIPPSAGKSTLCRAVQSLAEARSGQHFLYMGIEEAARILDTVPGAYRCS